MLFLQKPRSSEVLAVLVGTIREDASGWWSLKELETSCREFSEILATQAVFAQEKGSGEAWWRGGKQDRAGT